MGDRALIQLKDRGGNFSPVLYLHWKGDQVGSILQRTAVRMGDRIDDISYSFARLVQEAMMDDQGNLSFGVWNADHELTVKDSHGDAGVFLADVSSSTWKVKCSGGYGIPKADDYVNLIVEQEPAA